MTEINVKDRVRIARGTQAVGAIGTVIIVNGRREAVIELDDSVSVLRLAFDKLELLGLDALEHAPRGVTVELRFVPEHGDTFTELAHLTLFDPEQRIAEFESEAAGHPYGWRATAIDNRWVTGGAQLVELVEIAPTPRPWSDPLERQPRDVLIYSRNHREARVLDIRQSSRVGTYSADYLVELVVETGNELAPSWVSSELFMRN